MSAAESFEYIYRSATEVHWNAEGAYLYGPAVRAPSHAIWLQHIRDAVASEYGIKLLATESTDLRDLPEADRAECALTLSGPLTIELMQQGKGPPSRRPWKW